MDVSKVQVKYRGQLAALTGIAEESVEARNVEDLLRFIGKRYGREAEKTARAMLITLNGESTVLLKQFKTALREGNTVSFFPLSAGG